MAQDRSQTRTSTVALKAENDRLNAENARLKKQLHEKSISAVRSKRYWQKFGIIACVSLAGALLVAGNLLFWAGNTVVDNNKFVATTAPLIKQPAVQQGIAKYTTQQLYQNVDVQQEIQNVLPPRAAFLAPTLATQIKGATQSTLQKVLGNPKFQDVWNNTMAKTHARTINYIKNYQGNGTISLSDVYQSLSDQLKTTKLSFLANKQLPPKVGSITVVQASWLPAAHNLVTNINLYEWVAIFLLLVFSALSVYLAADRRKMVQTLGILFSILMIIELICIRLAVLAGVNKVSPDYQQAASQAVNIIAHPLIIQSRTLLALAFLTAFIAWISGPYRAARATRGRIQIVLEGKLHSAIFAHGDNRFTKWVGVHKRTLRWTSIGVVALIMLIVQLSPKLVLLYALLMLALVAIIEICAAPVKPIDK